MKTHTISSLITHLNTHLGIAGKFIIRNIILRQLLVPWALTRAWQGHSVRAPHPAISSLFTERSTTRKSVLNHYFSSQNVELTKRVAAL